MAKQLGKSLDPALVMPLDRFADRPFERALIAYDVARGALLGLNDGELVQRIATDIAPLKLWRTVSILVTDGEPIDGEIDLRLAKQLATTFG